VSKARKMDNSLSASCYCRGMTSGATSEETSICSTGPADGPLPRASYVLLA